MTIVEAIQRYSDPAFLEELDLAAKPPVDEIMVRKAGDCWFNRQLAVIFLGLVVMETASARIAFLHNAAESQLRNYISFSASLNSDAAAERQISADAWADMIGVLKKWVLQVHQHLCAERTTG